MSALGDENIETAPTLEQLCRAGDLGCVGDQSYARSDMILEEIERRAAGDDNPLWWAYRYVQQVAARADEATTEQLDSAVDQFVRLATEDPTWAAERVCDRGPEGHGMGRVLSGGRVDRALAKIRLGSVREDAMLRARMLVASVFWNFREKEGASIDIWKQAWQELLRVSEEERDEDWQKLALGPASRVDYPAYRSLADSHIARLGDFDRSNFLPASIAVAWRNGDWEAFDGWIVHYQQLPEALRHDHASAAVVSLQGLRALQEGRLTEAEKSMQELLALADGLTFLSNDDVSSLPKGLRAAGQCLDLCDRFEELVQKRDWRQLPR